MPILGAHMSIAGGYYKAVDAAKAAGCDCVQVFTKNNNQWRAKPITEKEVERFQEALAVHGITNPIAHNSYLINLGSPKDDLWKKSIDSMVVEVQRADQLGIPYVVAHPGSYTTSSEVEGLKRIAEGLNEVHKQTRKAKTKILLETTAGQGTNLGCRFEHLATILEKVRYPDRLGICWDTCHVFAAGYPTSTEKEYKSTMRQFNKLVGVKLIRAFHFNDSLKPFGSRVDRHAGIGRGEMGLEPFRFLLNDRRFRKIPMCLETPKGEEKGRDLDEINLEVLRGLVED
ncbi:MAG: deoxyribonuclease IV [Lacipirellulaceae bacterium]